MWNNGWFAQELLGTAFLVAGVIASITLSKKFKLQGIAALLFGALFAGVSLLGAVAIAEVNIAGSNGHGFVNPGVAFMAAIANNNWDAFLPSIVGEVLGGLIVALAFILIAKYFGKKDLKHLVEAFAPETSVNVVKNTVGEIIGTTLFFGGIATVAFGGIAHDGVVVAAMVGLSLSIGIVASSSFGSMLNAAVGLSLLVVRLALVNGKGAKFSFGNLVNGIVGNFAVGATIGGLVLAI